MIRIYNKNNNNNNYNNNNEQNDSSLEVMNYLIQKLDARQKKVYKFKLFFNELDSFQSFYSQRKEIYLLLNNLEEDLKQATFAIKALIMQNKSLLKEINIKTNENKNILNQLNFTIAQNENLNLKINALQGNIIQNMSNNNFNNLNDNNNNNLVNVNVDSIKVDEEEEYEEPKTKNLDLKEKSMNNIGFDNYNNYNFNSNNIRNNEKQDNNYEQLSNVKNIINDLRINKQNLKNIIDQHFKEQNININK